MSPDLADMAADFLAAREPLRCPCGAKCDHSHGLCARCDAWAETLTPGVEGRTHAAPPRLLTIQRTVLRQMFDEMDARASRAEADADRLAAAIISTGFAAERVSMALAMLQHDEAVAQR